MFQSYLKATDKKLMNDKQDSHPFEWWQLGLKLITKTVLHFVWLVSLVKNTDI